MPSSVHHARPERGNTPTIGFVGLGHIGEPMAARIAPAYPLVVYDLDPRSGADLADVPRVSDLRDLVRTCDLLFLSLPDGEASWQVVQAVTAVHDARAGAVVELSTVGPSWAQRCHRHASDAGWRYVDAPVSGGRSGALAGTLTTMVACPDQERTAVLPVLRRFAEHVFVVGDHAGLGQVMKLTNNAIALSVLPLTSEALTFGESYGLSLHAMLDIINASSGRTQRSEGMFRTSIASGRFDHGASGEITHKDMALYVEEARRAGTHPAIGAAVAALYGTFVEQHPGTDYSYLHEFVRNSCPDA